MAAQFNIAEILNQVLPMVTSLMNIMLAIMLVKEFMAIFRELRP